MNQITDTWKPSQPDYLPDGLQLDGEHRTMAPRKKPVTEPQMDSSQADTTEKWEHHLSKNEFNNVIRFIKNAPIVSINQLRTETWNNMKRLQVKRNLAKAPSGVPKGSDQVDIGTLITHLRSIQPTKSNEKAVEQLIAIDAALCKRFE